MGSHLRYEEEEGEHVCRLAWCLITASATSGGPEPGCWHSQYKH